MRVLPILSLLVITFIFLFFTPNISYSQMTLTTECNVKIADADRGMLYGKGYFYGAPNNKAKIVVKWKTGSVLNFMGTSNGDRAQGTWKNGNNTGTMSVERTSHTTFEGPLTWQNNTNTIYFYDCDVVYGRDSGNQAKPTNRVSFHNTGNINLTATVYTTYAVPMPNPIPSVVVFPGPPTITVNSAAHMGLAYGCYTFCVHWDTGKTDNLNQKIYSYRIIGDPFGPKYAVCHNENNLDNLVVKASSGKPDGTGVGYEGQCPRSGSHSNSNNSPRYPSNPSQPHNQQTESGSYLPPCDCTNPRNGKRFVLPTLITGACTDETVLDYLRPENYNCR